jgi:hypothetical protein
MFPWHIFAGTAVCVDRKSVMIAAVLKSGEPLDTSVRHASPASTATAQTNFIDGTEVKKTVSVGLD